MEKTGIDVTVRVSGADEDTDISEPSALVETLSSLKAHSVAKEVEAETGPDGGYCVIGADTVVSADGSILGKPVDEDDARSMLKRLSGRTHQVYTGVTLEYRHPGETESHTVSFHEKTDVCFCEMTDEEIDSYVFTGDPMDKAGAYGIQSYAAPYVSAIYGDYYNVMGLPACRLYHELKACGCLSGDR